MKKLNMQHSTLGILGGGQLGKMLLQKAADYNITSWVLDPDENAPARFLCNNFIIGDFRNYDDVYAFGKQVDVLTIEIEQVNVDALDHLSSEGLIIHPHPSIIRLVQDKGLQKEFYQKHNIPSPSFRLINNKSELSSVEDFPVVLKQRTMGYDGKGVMVLKNKADVSAAFDQPALLEKMVDIKKEISVIVARNASGQSMVYPAVEMEFNPEANLVEYLFSPSDISEEQKTNAGAIAVKLAELLDLTGILAVEMFIDQSGEVSVNEIAPRPHNSGHHTIEANITSQFEQLLRAIFDMPLGDAGSIHPSVMINLLGEKGYEGEAVYEGIESVLSMRSVYVHLYGKKVTRPFRKMGHITVTGSDLKALRKIANEIKEVLKIKA
ncbi:MAG TPA: 5-(carboxyamino)imidazole ribonucleotide synthase [Bacteroidia bacterium]|nr:5-(carboxyamino)imidazole ribonucleotide synthase [Bacteroidia bacterium]HNT79913.1 5-(carboxyamino)imidazole ribonucleotide synthase [Bacteroidia bacterium]